MSFQCQTFLNVKKSITNHTIIIKKMNIQTMGDGHPDFGATVSVPQIQIQVGNARTLAMEHPTQTSMNQRKKALLKPQDPDQDPIQKREAMARAARVNRKAAVLSQRRQELASSTLNVFYCNCRGINGQWKQEMLAQQVAPGYDLLMLSETKLTRKWVSQGDFTMQTQKRRYGGCLIATNNKQAKAIKGLNTSIAWATIKVVGRLVHVITCYLEPGNSRKRDAFKQQFEGILHSIRLRDKEASIIIAGDFNEARSDVDTITQRAGLSHVIDPTAPTHIKGGHLDQMYTNLEVVQQEVKDIHPKFTDHKGISARLRIKQWRRVSPPNEDERNEVTIGQITRESTKETTIMKLLERANILEREAKETYLNQLAPKRTNPRWYQSTYRKKAGPNQEGILLHPSGEQRRAEWTETIQQLEALHRIGDWKEFFKITKRITKIQKGGCPIKGILSGDSEILDKDEVDKILASHFREVYGEIDNDDQEMAEEAKQLELFGVADIEEAIQNTNFNKSIGPDGFSGTTLNSSQQLRERVKVEIAARLNNADIPQYLRQGRLTALSKVFGKDIVQLDDVRPIVIRSHISKVMEKAVLKKIKTGHSHLIRTLASQTGFKEGQSTHQNIARILRLLHPGKKRKQRRALLLIDLQKAYDSVNRQRLIEVLRKRCRGEGDTHLVNLVEKLIGRAEITIGKQLIRTKRGLPQGSVLAPLLFNVYLEEAIKSQPRLWQKYKAGLLLAYADDMVAQAKGESDIRTLVTDFKLLEEEWGLKINPKKCEIVGLGKGKQIEGVNCVETAKYLGLILKTNPKEQKKSAIGQITRNLAIIKKRLWISNLDVKECVLNAFVRSILIYIATPMQAAGLWQNKDVKALECRFHREIHGIPRDISNQAMMNVMQQATPVAEIIASKVKILKQKLDKQMKMCEAHSEKTSSEGNTEVDTSNRRERIYLPKVLAQTMLALTRGRTIMYFNSRHTCMQHKCTIDDQHIRECEQFTGVPDIARWIMRLREQNIREWSRDERDAAIISFGLLKLRLEEMKSAGTVNEIIVDNSEMHAWQEIGNAGGNTPLIVKRGRGRPRKIEKQQEGQTKMEQFFISK